MRCFYINLDRCPQRNNFLRQQIATIPESTFGGNITGARADQIIQVAQVEEHGRLPVQEHGRLPVQEETKVEEGSFPPGLSFYRVPALDGRKVRKSQLQFWQQKGLLLPPSKAVLTVAKTGVLYNGGRLCTFMSHVGVWAHVYATRTENEPYVLILEDDVVLPAQLRGACDMLTQKVKDANIEWDVIFIGHAGALKGETVIENLLLKPAHGVWPDTNHGMFAYLLKISSIPRLLRTMLPIPGEPVFAHVDNHLRKFYDRTNCYYTLADVIRHMDHWTSVRVRFDKPYRVRS
jgi:GR25 family glycosyltransferase involved in LPS biosynthesis